MSNNDFVKWVPILIILLSQWGCHNEASKPAPGVAHTFSERVKVFPVKIEAIPLFYEAAGTIKARITTTLSSKMQGNIKKITVNEGDLVEAGRTLVIIDDRDVRAKLRQAEAAYESAKALMSEVGTAIGQANAGKRRAEAELSLAQTTFNRFEKLYAAKAASQQDFDSAKARLDVAREVLNGATERIGEALAKKKTASAMTDQARSAVDEMNVTRSFSVIKAPFDGLVVKKHAEAGNMALPGVPLLTLDNPGGFRLEVNVREEEFVSQVTVGKQVDVFLDAFGKRKVQGQVSEIVPTADSLSRTFKVKIALPPLEGLKSGMYGKAICSRGERRGILIPEKALKKTGQLEQVFSVTDDSIARLRLIKSGKRFKNTVEVLAGLKVGDIIVSEFPHGLKDGYIVEREK